ncbi:MAG: hypothetical protein NTZ48_03820, partial [Candidatus Omnitrophica bacterium]|nr:hypothetical protein [Candidatus Omnitrophota bacterium]
MKAEVLILKIGMVGFIFFTAALNCYALNPIGSVGYAVLPVLNTDVIEVQKDVNVALAMIRKGDIFGVRDLYYIVEQDKDFIQPSEVGRILNAFRQVLFWQIETGIGLAVHDMAAHSIVTLLKNFSIEELGEEQLTALYKEVKVGMEASYSDIVCDYEDIVTNLADLDGSRFPRLPPVSRTWADAVTVT